MNTIMIIFWFLFLIIIIERATKFHRQYPHEPFYGICMFFAGGLLLVSTAVCVGSWVGVPR